MNLVNWFYRHNSKKYLLIFGVISIIGITLIYSRYFGLISISNDLVLDMSFVYSQTTFYDVLHTLNQSEILAYKLVHIADYVFAIGFYPILIILFTKVVHKVSSFRLVVLLPLVSGVFDLLENLSMDIHLYVYPSEFIFLGSLSPIFTVLKFSVLLVSLALMMGFFFKSISCRNRY